MKKYLPFNIFISLSIFFFVKSLLFLSHFGIYSKYICIVYMNYKLNKSRENKIQRVKITSDP